jgi:hypothetical protein
MNSSLFPTFRSTAPALAAFLLCYSIQSCHNTGGPATEERTSDSLSVPNTSRFMERQFRQMDSLNTSLMMYKTENGKADSGMISLSDAKKLLTPFLGLDTASGLSTTQYSRNVFADSSQHRTVTSYEATSDSAALTRVDIYTDSGSGDIRQLYLQYQTQAPDSSIRLQLIWKTDQDFTLIRTVDKHQYTVAIRKQKVIWNTHR